MKNALVHLAAVLLCAALASCTPDADDRLLRIVESGDGLAVHSASGGEPLLVQNALPDFRPYLHPVAAPDGRGFVTEFSPDHHRHQTGLYWGFTRLNGRDYFHHPEGDYWRRAAVEVIAPAGNVVRWRLVYDLLGERGETVLTETQDWSMRLDSSGYVLDLEWRGDAHVDVTVGEYDYGGLFLRMPWQPGIEGFAVNAARQRNRFAEGKRAMWLDLGIRVPGRDDLAHVAIFDHPDNEGFPHPWRVDGQLGVGPVRARLGDWTIDEGQSETIRHRMLVYTGAHRELRGAWEAYAGLEGQTYSTAALWGLAQEEARDAEFLSPDEAAGAMTPMEGYSVEAWAGEPLVTQPIAFAWDDRGRLWVAENRDYESRSTGFSGSGDSRVVILEDADRDGRAEKRTVFLEGIAFPSAIAVGFGGIFLGAPPHLLFVPDRDGDDRADMDDIEIRLTGWGIRDRHETINSFHWGPDGWLYGLEGFATTSRIRKPAADARLYRGGDPFPEGLLEEEGVDINGGVWRYHPVKDRFEVVAHGFSNPWGIDYDANGELFISACVIPHLFHVIPGGLYQRQGGQHYNPYAYRDIGPIVDHRHRSAHGGARVYQSDAFPADQRGRLFMANIHEHAVLTDMLDPVGSGYVASHGDEFLLANNAQWVGFSVEIGPEGALYILDWHDADICGGEVLDKDTGRIFRVTPQESRADQWPGRYDDLRAQSDLDLAQLQRSPSDWHARRARVILQERATERPLDADAEAELMAQFEGNDATTLRLKAMWALHVAGRMTRPRLEAALEDDEAHVRAWALRLFVEDPDPDPAHVQRLERLARRDTSPVVRKYLAAALQRVPPDARWNLAAALLAHAGDASDHNIPVLIWLGVEPLVETDPDRALELAGASRIPLVTEFIGRRLVDADLLDVLVEGILEREGPRLDLLRGMRSGLEGRQDVARPAAWSRVANALRGERRAQSVVTEISQLFGDAEAAARMMTVVLDEAQDTDGRTAALQSLAQGSRDTLLGALPALLDDPLMQREAIRAVAAYDDPGLGSLLLERYAEYGPQDQLEVVQTLASRPTYGWMLTDALKDGELTRDDIPSYVARQLRRVVGSGFVEVWGPIDGLSGGREAQYQRYRSLLTPERVRGADPAHGRQLFAQACGACHRMHGEGGDVGPDITGANLTSIDYILGNVISPGEDIQDDYRMVIVTMRDGRSYLGSIAAESERQLTMRQVGLDPVVLDKSEIQSRETSNSSLMPDGIFQTLADSDVLDLVAFLQAEHAPQP